MSAELLREHVEKPPASSLSETDSTHEMAVCLPRGNKTIRSSIQRCLRTLHSHHDPNRTGLLARVGARFLNRQEGDAIVEQFCQWGLVVPRQEIADQEPGLVKLAVCVAPFNYQGLTVVRPRLKNPKSPRLTMPVMETVQPEDFQLAFKMGASWSYRDSLFILAIGRALEEEASTFMSMLGYVRPIIVAGGKDLGLVLSMSEWSTSLEELAENCGGIVIPSKSYMKKTREIGYQPDGWTASVLSLIGKTIQA